MIFVDAPGEANNGPPGVLVPIGSAQAGEGGDHIAAVGIGHLAGVVLAVGGGLDEAHLVPEPLDGGSRHEDGALQSIVHMAIQPPGHGGHQTVLGEYRGLAGVHQQEAAGAVGVLGLTGREAGLTEEGSLLVSGGSGDGNGSTEKSRICGAVDAAAGHRCGQ